MPRRRFADDDRDDGPPDRSRNNTPLLLTLLLGGGILLLVLVVGGGLVAYLAIGRAKARADAAYARAEAAEAAARAPDFREPDLHGGAAANVPPVAAPPARPVLSRQDFEAAVRWKNGDQIIAAVGRPDDTRDGGGVTTKFEWWIFRGRVMNPATGKPYPVASVQMEYGKQTGRIEYP
jgi:hypothetical protein